MADGHFFDPVNADDRYGVLVVQTMPGTNPEAELSRCFGRLLEQLEFMLSLTLPNHIAVLAGMQLDETRPDIGGGGSLLWIRIGKNGYRD